MELPMPRESQVGRVFERHGKQRYDWIASDGCLLYNIPRLLQSPFFPARGREWRMTVHLSPNDKVTICMGCKVSHWVGADRFEVGIVTVGQRNEEIKFTNDQNDDCARNRGNGVCVLEGRMDVDELQRHVTNCGGRLMVYCKFLSDDETSERSKEKGDKDGGKSEKSSGKSHEIWCLKRHC